MTQAALLGGPRAVSLPLPEWPRIDDETIAAVVRVLKSEPLCPVGNTGIQGEFEDAFAAFHERRFALATNGGTAALMLSVHGAGVEPGDEVICSPFSWGASVACVLQCAAIPVFADISARTLGLDAASVRSRITPRTRAILPVHIFGAPCDMDGILEVADEHGIPVIEDVAQAAGGFYRGRRLGSLGAFSAFSLQASKNLTGGEGGILVCDDREMFERAMSHGTHPQRLVAELELPEFRRRIDSLAFNFRMHTASAAIAHTQLRHLDAWTEIRNQNAQRLYAAVRDLEYLEFPPLPDPAEGSRHGFYHIPFLYRPGVLPLDRDQFVAALEAEGAPAGCYVKIPLYLRPRLRMHDYVGRDFPWCLGEGSYEYGRGDCPVAEALCEKEWQLKASFHEPLPELIDQIVQALRKVGETADEISAAAATSGVVSGGRAAGT